MCRTIRLLSSIKFPYLWGDLLRSKYSTREPPADPYLLMKHWGRCTSLWNIVAYMYILKWRTGHHKIHRKMKLSLARITFLDFSRLIWMFSRWRCILRKSQSEQGGWWQVLLLDKWLVSLLHWLQLARPGWSAASVASLCYCLSVLPPSCLCDWLFLATRSLGCFPCSHSLRNYTCCWLSCSHYSERWSLSSDASLWVFLRLWLCSNKMPLLPFQLSLQGVHSQYLRSLSTVATWVLLIVDCLVSHDVIAKCWRGPPLAK